MSENLQHFQDMAERLFGDHVDAVVLDSADATGLPLALWQAVADSGMPLLLVDEAHGGIGADLPDAMAILRVAGRHAAPVPLLETLVGNAALARAGLEPVDGPLALVFADDACRIGGDGALSLDRPELELPWPAQTVGLVVLGRSPEGVFIVFATLDQDAVAQAGAVYDARGECRRRVPASALRIARSAPCTDAGAYDALFRLAALLRAGQMNGALDWCLERTVEYAGERKQFGREIGRFQVVQQMLAELASAVVAASAIVDAATQAGLGDEAVPLLAAARSRLGDSVDVAVAVSHQVHGAIGFSREYALNHRTRRLMVWRDEYGRVAAWRRALADHFSGLEADALWPAITRLGAAAAA